MEEKLISSEMSESEENKRYVPWIVFSWAIGLIFIILGWVIWAEAGFASQWSVHNDKDLGIQTQLTQIQTDLLWIKNYMEKQTK